MSTFTFHSLSVEETLTTFGTSRSGLTAQEVEARLERDGLNQIEHTSQVSAFKILLSQFKSFMVLLLVVAAIMSVLIGETIDAVIILAIMVINAVIGFAQEFKAEQAIENLKEHQVTKAIVIRDGDELEIESPQLVVGDVIVLEEGQKVPADARIIESVEMQVDESLLTGESKQVNKMTDPLPESTLVGDRQNSLFSGTTVVAGRGIAVVTAIGNTTELGQIAQLALVTDRTLTPLQVTLDSLGRWIGMISVALAVPGFLLGVATGRDWHEIALTSIALAVSAIPEGLPIVVTVALAFGIKRMITKQVLIRRLSAVEALGSVDVICTDKTGTITENKMIVQQVLTHDELAFAQAMILCSNATEHVGDPTERALVVFAREQGQAVNLREQWPRLKEIPFQSKNKYMVTLHQVDQKKMAFVKGAPEKVMGLTNLSPKAQAEQLEIAEKLAADGYRVLAFGHKQVDQVSEYKKLEDYFFLGFVAMQDPPRAGVRDAIDQCRRAGIRTIMITGDHPQTAAAIAQQVGLGSTEVITGKQLSTLSDEQLSEIVKEVTVFARVSPKHKLRILAALQAQGNFVAMTGDGVNDAPALRQANIGIAVGSGADLAKETADMIILDDNFVTIVDAIYEGRGIFSNIKKFVTFLLAVNFDEIAMVVMSYVLGLPLPMLPIHLLWLNVVSDSFPALALAVDPYEPGLMKQKPYDPKTEILRGIFKYSILAGSLAFISSFGTFLVELFVLSQDLATAQTMSFTVTVLFEIMIVFALRSHQRLKDSKPLSNKWLLIGVTTAIFLHLLVVYLPGAHHFFETVALPLDRWLLLTPLAVLGVLGFEIAKIIKKDW